MESQLGKGTVFTFIIPFKLAKPYEINALTQAKEMEYTLEGKRILAAEDNEINRMIVVAILGDKGCELTEACNGQEALEAFERSPEYYFDLILMDIQMPVMDGYEATRQIRALPRHDAITVPIIAMTANAFREDIEKALASGMIDVATKPLDIKMLIKKINRINNSEE